ncbi:DUF6801 domain-containing protein [Amycolatopsis vancoresmycina]|uniref:DUF6801 domain-containing protein n=1 Tax=Amycolatopsis vancoresmycina DSM 44592 TaxID=1292037 RepID=R1G4Z5_9PSEU|nr:DUF6801 domain-containing protein [Amycolatopsis vancoresmycina]EOD66512.1 hypothetical protein H480_20962 [Amycolatopsis vancoresmycina DSM 44592]
MGFRRFLTASTATVLVLAGTAGPARAATTYDTPPGGVLYNCTFPGVGPQPVTAVAEFTGPDGVAAGSTFPITGISGTIYLGTTTRNLMRALGYDGVRGTGMVPVTASNATLDSSTGGTIPEQYWPPLTGTIGFAAGSESFVAGGPGVIVFGTGTPFSLTLQFHRAPNNTWTTAWVSSCTLKVTSPAQNTLFSPDLLVT